jgi:ABC-type Fe3+-hydroxamate transport system substrate-binding protein
MKFIDQLNRQVILASWPPTRIISLVPSQTELLYDLGLDAEVLGITKFCVHPEAWYRQKNRVGGTKTLNLAKIGQLQPDLIIANKEENDEHQIKALSQLFPVWISDVKCLSDALAMIREVGVLTNKTERAESISTDIASAFEQLRPERTKTAAYLIWRKPYMVAASDTFIHDMLGKAGYENVFASQERYPQTDLLELSRLGPQVILLSSEPYPFSEKHRREIQEACPNSRILLVDGELFSWYGSRLLQAPLYFEKIYTNS